MKPIPALTSLRFFAAFAILALHYRDLLGTLPQWLMRTLVCGQYGVTFFFVLSGFILTYNYHGWFGEGVAEGAFWKFQKLRFARIYPMYFVGLLLDTPWHLIERIHAGQLANSGLSFWAAWVLNLAGLQAWVPGTPYAMFWNTPAWSVSAEFFFYATFPFVCFYLVRHVKKETTAIMLMMATVILSTLMFAGVVYLLNYVLKVEKMTNYLIISYNPILRYAEFFAGCLAGIYFLRTSHAPVYRLSFLFDTQTARNILIVLCFIIVALRAYQPQYTGPSGVLWVMDNAIKYSAFILPFSLIILAIAKGRNFLSRFLERPLLILLGEASYCLYIIHWSVTSFINLALPATLKSPLLDFLFLIGTVFLSVFFYRFVEMPMRQKISGRKKTPIISRS